MKAETCFKCRKTAFCRHYWAAHGRKPNVLAVCAACLEAEGLGYDE